MKHKIYSMDLLLITLIALWINPIAGAILSVISKKREGLRRKLLITFMTISVLEILAIITRISFTSTAADFIFIALFYLGICFGIWILVSANNAILRNMGRLLGVLVFGANYLISTVGALGLAFVLNDWTPQQEINLDKNLEYREISLGMATDDYRGKRVEIFREIGFLPLERQIMQKVYINEIPWSARKLEVKYNKQAGELYLSAAVTGRDNTIRNWKETIKIN